MSRPLHGAQNMSSTTLEYLIDHQRVTCTYVAPNRRKWHCGCADFARRAELYREGFCAHVVCAIEQAVQQGQIELSSTQFFEHRS